MFVGTLTHEQMEEEHALELERLQAGGLAYNPPPPDVLRKRQRTFIVGAGMVAVVTMAILFWMFTFEQTAITTVQPIPTTQVFVPLATPVP